MSRRGCPPVMRTYDLGIDIGSANLVVASARQGVIFAEPSCIALSGADASLLGFGYDAVSAGRHAAAPPQLVYPVTRGRPDDAASLGLLIRQVIRKIKRSGISCRSAFIAVSPFLKRDDRRTIERTVQDSGVEETTAIENLVAASNSTRRIRDTAKAAVIVDIGAEVTSWGMIAEGQLERFGTWEFGMKDLAAALVELMLKRYGLSPDLNHAESIIMALGCRGWNYPGLSAQTQVRCGKADLPVVHTVWAGDVTDAIGGCIFELSDRLRQFFEKISARDRKSLLGTGVEICGGGSLIPDIGSEIATRTGIPVRMSHSPLHTVACGAAQTLIRF